MPINGKIFDSASYHFDIQSSASGSHSGIGTGEYSHSASIQTNWTPDAIGTAWSELLTFVSLQVSATTVSGGSQTLTYNGPSAPFGGYSHTISGYSSAVSGRVQFNGTKVYCKLTGGLLRFVVSSIGIYMNGTLLVTLSGFDVVSNGCGPSYINYCGIPGLVSGSCGASTDGLPGTMPTTYDYSSSISQSIVGGWGFSDAFGDQSLPMTILGVSLPSGSGCPYGLGLGYVSSSGTDGVSISQYSYSESKREYVTEQTGQTQYEVLCGTTPIYGPVTVTSYCTNLDGSSGVAKRKVYKDTTISESYGGSAYAMPDLPRGVARMQSGYRSIWYRIGFPKTTSSGSRTCTINGVTTSASLTSTVHPTGSAFLASVTDSTHTIEQPLGLNCYAPMTQGHSKSQSQGYEYVYEYAFCACPPPGQPGPGSFTCPDPDLPPTANCILTWPGLADLVNQSESVSFSFPATVEDSTSNPQMSGWQYHQDPIARYWNYWGNPLWQYAHWFPPNDGSGEQTQWPLDDGSVDNAYWKGIRDQKSQQASLPSGENTHTRVSNIASIWDEGGLTPLLDAEFGSFRLIGVHRWITENVSPLSSYTYTSASASLFSGTNCTLSYISGGIVITPTGSGPCTVTLNCASWTVMPYLYPHLCNQITVGWEPGNVASASVAMVGVDGTSQQIATAAGTYSRPTVTASAYAGSWGIDNGDGYTGGDQGTDVPSGGLSAATMADPTRCFAFELLPGKTCAKLTFTLTPTDHTHTMTLHYPQWIGPSEPPTQVWESGQCVDWLYPSGPGVRWGNWIFYDPMLGFQQPPEVIGLGYKSTIVDALCTKRAVFLAADPLTGGGPTGAPSLTTEIASLYDAYEGQSIAQCDEDGISFVLPNGSVSGDKTVRFALCNSFAEIPPIGAFPFRGRSPADWSPSDPYTGVVWDWSQEARYLVAQGANVPSISPPSSSPWSSSDTAPAGWAIAKYIHSVTDSEDSTFNLKTGSTTWAHVAPWHGYFGILSKHVVSHSPWHIQDQYGRIHVASVNSDGDVLYQRADTVNARTGWAVSGVVTSFGDVQYARMFLDGSMRIYLLVLRLSHTGTYSIYELYSDDDGNNFDSGTLLMSNAIAPDGWHEAIGGSAGVTWFEYDSGTSGRGVQKAIYRDGDGNTSWSSPFTFVNNSGNPIHVADGGWSDVEAAANSPRYLTWTPVIDGETAPSIWHSIDNARSWIRDY